MQNKSLHKYIWLDQAYQKTTKCAWGKTAESNPLTIQNNGNCCYQLDCTVVGPYPGLLVIPYEAENSIAAYSTMLNTFGWEGPKFLQELSEQLNRPIALATLEPFKTKAVAGEVKLEDIWEDIEMNGTIQEESKQTQLYEKFGFSNFYSLKGLLELYLNQPDSAPLFYLRTSYNQSEFLKDPSEYLTKFIEHIKNTWKEIKGHEEDIVDEEAIERFFEWLKLNTISMNVDSPFTVMMELQRVRTLTQAGGLTALATSLENDGYKITSDTKAYLPELGYAYYPRDPEYYFGPRGILRKLFTITVFAALIPDNDKQKEQKIRKIYDLLNDNSYNDALFFLAYIIDRRVLGKRPNINDFKKEFEHYYGNCDFCSMMNNLLKNIDRITKRAKQKGYPPFDVKRAPWITLKGLLELYQNKVGTQLNPEQKKVLNEQMQKLEEVLKEVFSPLIIYQTALTVPAEVLLTKGQPTEEIDDIKKEFEDRANNIRRMLGLPIPPVIYDPKKGILRFVPVRLKPLGPFYGAYGHLSGKITPKSQLLEKTLKAAKEKGLAYIMQQEVPPIDVKIHLVGKGGTTNKTMEGKGIFRLFFGISPNRNDSNQKIHYLGGMLNILFPELHPSQVGNRDNPTKVHVQSGALIVPIVFNTPL